MTPVDFSALRYGPITLHRITEQNIEALQFALAPYPDGDYMIDALYESYAPRYDSESRQIKYGFYTTYDDEMAGMSLLGIADWQRLRGYTGADTLAHMRGHGIAPGSKPHLFYLGFALLGLYRIETGCLVSNASSKRSLDKTPGLVFEGTLRGWFRWADGRFEDEHRYSIIRPDWERLYGDESIEVLP